MKKLLIIGAGNIAGYFANNISELGAYEIVGFFDDDCQKWGKSFYNWKVLGCVDSVKAFIANSLNEAYSVVLCVASPQAKRIIVKKLSGLPIEFPSFISNRAWISKNVAFGRGIIVYPGSSINYDTDIGDFVTVNMNCAIGHNCEISSFVTLAPGVNLAGFTRIDEGAEVGIGAATIQNIRIGKEAIVGGQAMIIKNVPDSCTVVGNPGQIVKMKGNTT